MARPGTQTRNSPRKSALAKAALRKSAAGGPAQGHKPASKAELAEALAQRPKVNFLDPLMRHAAMKAKGISLCAFLVTLAAFQRGLKVTFHYERASFDPRFAKAKMQGHRGELFSISNGTRTHTFSRTMGDLTDSAANAIAEDKHLTKAALKRAGVRTPEGIVVDKNQTALVQKFLAQHPGKRFVVKPFDGSLAKDVDADIPSEQVISSVSKHAGRVILEEHIAGIEYRATVINGRCVAVSRRLRPYVIGDGKSSVAALVGEFNKSAEASPYWGGVKDESATAGYLARQGRTMSSIPNLGEEIFLSNTSYGVQHEDVTGSIGDAFRNAVSTAALTIGLVTSGIDVIVTPSGEPIILELNQRSYIGFHSFPKEGPGQGNAVAESIVDCYFPETIRARTLPTLAYDFAPIHAALESAQVSELSLPVIGPDWRVLRFVETGIAARAMVKLIERAARVAGVFVMNAPRPKGGVEICLAYGPSNWRAFMTSIPAQFRTRLEKLAA
jgi:cyanophycin synthetase